jgi:hypothetical protein
VAASPHGHAVFRQSSHISTGCPCTTSVDVNPRDARLDDTSSAAPVKLTVRPQRFAGPVRCWRPGWDTGSGGAGQIASQGTGASSWQVKMASCLITFQSSALTRPPAPRSTTLRSPGSADAA